VAVEPTSWAVLACDRTGDRSGALWQEVLQPFTALQFVVSDAAGGMAAAVHALADARAATEPAGVPLSQGLDVFHTAREAQRVLAGPWRRAEAAWEAAETWDKQVAHDKQQGRDARRSAACARRAWERAERAYGVAQRQESAWQRIAAALEVFLPDGRLNERRHADEQIRTALLDLAGPQWQKVRRYLSDPRSLAFLDRLHERLVAVVPDEGQRAGWVKRWWLRHRAETEPQTAVSGTEWGRRLVEEVIRQRELSQDEQAEYERVGAVLRTTVRASSAVEGINSVLRMQQCRHRQMTQGMLDLKRLYWNCRRLPTGKRRQHSPYELLGLQWPTLDFWELLQSVAQKKEQTVST